MVITSVSAIPLMIPVRITGPLHEHTTALSICLCRIETSNGLVGCGLTGITEEEVVATAIDAIAAPALIGADPTHIERLWERLYWLLMPRGQTGYASHALSAIDIALWDIKAQALGLPLWHLLGGARSRVPVYATFGFGFYSRDELALAARQWADKGFSRLKMTVGSHALARRDEPRLISGVISEDGKRVEAVRQAIGPDAELFIDANCSLDLHHAQQLATSIKPFNIGFFEEPLTQNDVRQLAHLRRTSGLALAAGQNEGLAYRFRDLLVHEAVDVLQPNVAISGGYSQCVKIAGMAQAFNTPIDNGGAWPFHNMHLHAGVSNGGMVEYHHVAVELLKQVYDDLPEPVDGWLDLPHSPGLGFKPNWDRIAKLRQHPLSQGKGKA
jgi:L-rhamnonate dehydratase